MNENSHQNIPAEAFLDWVSELEQGENQDFVLTTQQIRQVTEKSSSFDFLHAEPDLYTLADGEPI